jgi:hypothetical protein
LLLVRILRLLEIPGAWLAAAIFALHPIQAESVAWISELKNMLSGVFYFGSVLAYLKFDRTKETMKAVRAIGGAHTKRKFKYGKKLSPRGLEGFRLRLPFIKPHGRNLLKLNSA